MGTKIQISEQTIKYIRGFSNRQAKGGCQNEPNSARTECTCNAKLRCAYSLVQKFHPAMACSSSISCPFFTVAPCCAPFCRNRVVCGL